MSHAPETRLAVLEDIAAGHKLLDVVARHGVALSTIVKWRDQAGVVSVRGWGQHAILEVGPDHDRVLQAVARGAEGLGAVRDRMGREQVTTLEVERLARELVQGGYLCALDGEPWALTLLGKQRTIGVRAFIAWRARTPERARSAS